MLFLVLAACVGKPSPGPDADPPLRDGPVDTDPTDTSDTSDTSDTPDTSDTSDPVDADADGWPAPEDCDDADPAVFPGATETCDGVDADCDGVVDFGWRVPDDYATIPGALAAATGGEHICVAPGDWAGPIDFAGKDVIVESDEGAAVTRLYGDGSGPVVRFVTGEAPGAQLRGFTVTGGVAEYGGGVHVDGAGPTLTDLIVTANLATDTYDAGGGGIYVTGGTPELVRVDIVGNTLRATTRSARGGGLYAVDSTLRLTDVRVLRNTTSEGYEGTAEGAGLALERSTAYARRLQVVGNVHAGWYGTGVGASLIDAELTGTNVVIAGNTGRGVGGAVYARASRLGLRNATLAGNTAGGVYLADSAASTLWNAAITGNSGDGTGDGLYVDGVASAAVRYTDLHGNGALDVGGMDDPVGADGNVSVAPDYADTTSADPTAWDLSLAAGSALLDAGDPAILDFDGSPSDIGAWGGPDASAGTDEPGCTPVAWYGDADRDGFGAGAETLACAWPGPGWGRSAEDCDDADDGVHPLATEDCDGVDDDCDGAADTPECVDSVGTADAVLHGEVAGDGAGDAVAVLGDVDGDGVPELAVTASSHDGASGYEGMLWVVSGAASGDTSLSAALARVEGAAYDDRLGGAVTSAGDADGDGYADLWVSATRQDGGVGWGGAVYLLRGPMSGDVPVTDAAFVLYGAVGGDAIGEALASAFDADGDGDDDLLVGGSDARSNDGAAWLLSGATGLSGTGSVADAGVELIGEGDSGGAGNAVAAGDLDGDGLADLVVGASSQDATYESSGAAYVVLAPAASTSLAAADGRFTGTDDRTYAGRSVATPGDVDGDGLGDLLVGEPTGGGGYGAAWLVPGPATGDTDLGSASAGSVVGDAGVYYLGGAVAGLGDLDGDGFADVAVGAPYEGSSGSRAGAVYIFRGPLAGSLGVADAARTSYGEAADDQAGRALAGGDIDGDGAFELLIAAPGRDEAASGDGAVYVIGL